MTKILFTVLISGLLFSPLASAAPERWDETQLIEKLQKNRVDQYVFCNSADGKFTVGLDPAGTKLVLGGLLYGKWTSHKSFSDYACEYDNRDNKVLCKIDRLRSVEVSLDNVNFVGARDSVGDQGDHYRFDGIVKAGSGLLSVDSEEVECTMTLWN